MEWVPLQSSMMGTTAELMHKSNDCVEALDIFTITQQGHSQMLADGLFHEVWKLVYCSLFFTSSYMSASSIKPDGCAPILGCLSICLSALDSGTYHNEKQNNKGFPCDNTAVNLENLHQYFVD